MWLIATCFAIALLASLALVPVVRRIAIAGGLVDRPDKERKLHHEPIALAGGVAVFAAVVIAFSATISLDRTVSLYWLGGAVQLGYLAQRWYVLFGCAAAILGVGLIDDIWTLRGRQKLMLQCLIILVMVGSGTVVREISLFGWEFPLGIFAIPVSVLWLLVAVNALNLLDGADGMATTAGMIISAGLGILSLHAGSPLSGVVALALSASLLGFLAYNRPPASIFLGDAGSMTIGLLVGVLAVWSTVKESTVLASAPIAILAIPLFDSTAAIARRWLTGRSIYATDRGHMHHLLQARFGSVGMLVAVAVLCTTTTGLAVASVVFDQAWISGAGVVLAIGTLIATRSFGHSEFRLVLSQSLHFLQSFTTQAHRCDSTKQHRQVQMQGTGKWETVWEPIVDFARFHELARVKIDVNLSWLHDGYHATWQSIRLPDKAYQLSIRLPLFAHRRADDAQVLIGRLEIIAPGDDRDVYERLSHFAAKLTDLAPQIDAVVADLERRQAVPGVSRAAAPSGAGETEVEKTELDSMDHATASSV